DQERAHPLCRVVRARVDVDRQRDHGEPCPEARGEGRKEEEPEARRPAEQSELAAERLGYQGYELACPATRRPMRPSASERKACSSRVPTVTRIARGAPNPCSGRTITPSRSNRSNRPRESSPTSAYRKFPTAGPAGSSPCERRI